MINEFKGFEDKVSGAADVIDLSNQYQVLVALGMEALGTLREWLPGPRSVYDAAGRQYRIEHVGDETGSMQVQLRAVDERYTDTGMTYSLSIALSPHPTDVKLIQE